MHRQPLLKLLAAHRPFDESEAAMLQRTIDFVRAHDDCFERSLLVGHVTGSAWVRGESGVLLLHHAKLNRWLQPGGHCDGDADVLRVTIKEAREESGLEVEPVSTAIFDVDVHWIPQRGDVPGHWHYDVRFLLRAINGNVQHNHESHGFRWVPLEEIRRSEDESLRRMALKT
jgi:8-oxo-dGTP pyrophosphatase MutT (NUDIX family)